MSWEFYLWFVHTLGGWFIGWQISIFAQLGWRIWKHEKQKREDWEVIRHR